MAEAPTVALPIPVETPVVVHPGDILIVRVNTRDATQESVNAIARHLREVLPNVVDVLVVAADELAVVRG